MLVRILTIKMTTHVSQEFIPKMFVGRNQFLNFFMGNLFVHVCIWKHLQFIPKIDMYG